MTPQGDGKQSTRVAPVFNRRRFLAALAAGSGGLAIASLMAACSSAAPASAPQQPAPTAAGNTAAKPAQAAPGGFANAGTLKILMSSHFVPSYDTWFDQWASDWGKKNKVEVQSDHILS